MNITFAPLEEKHFSNLLTWLNQPHVSKWYGELNTWTRKDIDDKYRTYIDSYKIEDGIKKTIYAYIIECDGQPIGYIQYYNAYDFNTEGYKVFDSLPKSLAAIDLFIGEISCIGKGIGPQCVKLFLTQYVWPHFDYCLVDPDARNAGALKAFERAGFSIVKILEYPEVILMLASKNKS